jgi:nucleotide-binding universal stress UspA family protein
MTDENEQAGKSADARDDRAATDFMDATIALSDLGAKVAAASPPMRLAPELPPGSMWAEVEAANQSVREQVADDAEAVRARAAAAAVHNAREAVEFGQQHGIPVPPHILQRARAGQDD